VERANAIAPSQVITGRVVDEPSLNRDLKGRFRIAVQRLQVLNQAGQLTFQMPVAGKAYVTAPLLQVTGLHKGQLMHAKGSLYLPQTAKNPNGFDFQHFLAERGTFTGFVADELRFHDGDPWGLWRVRQRVVRAQIRALGSPLGQLVSAMALGRKAVDLPADIQELFSRVGLAHTIAASGFHVSLLLGTVLAVVRSRTRHTQVALGGIVLVGYIILTGLQASVVRAALMGGAALVGIATDRKVIPSRALLIAVTLMLLVNPHWIWNIGFQLSVMATWGLLVTVPAITQRLDWLPVTLASFIAVPIAATLWTLPLMLYHFNTFSGLSVGLNIVATPLVTVISLGGIASSVLALGWPSLGTWIAHGLYWPAQMLLWLARTSSQLPGSSIAIGQISLWQLSSLYVILGLMTGLCPVPLPKMMARGGLLLAFMATLLLPVGWQFVSQHQVVVLAAGNELIWTRQIHGHTTLLNSGSHKTAFYTVAPFLRQAGVNKLDEAIALPFSPDYLTGWQTLLSQTPVRHLYSHTQLPQLSRWVRTTHDLKPGASYDLADINIQLLGVDNPIVRVEAQKSWVLLPTLSPELQTHLATMGSDLSSDVLVWPGGDISEALLSAIKPQTIICYGDTLSEALERRLHQLGIQVFWTRRDGAVIWQPGTGFYGHLASKHRNPLPWG
jgi:competence protein ComEC